MRVTALFALVVLASCGEPDAEESRTAFAAPTTGSIARKSGSADTPRLAPFKPMATDAEVLQGDPDAEGEPFVIRIRELPGTIIPPHSHPVDEHLTIVSGTLHFAFGENFDPARLTPLPTGSYGFAPKGSTMFASAPDGAVAQVHGIGPFHISWRHGSATLEDPASEKLFRFRRGNRVTTSRGEGVIRQGYASGPIIQYEIDAGLDRRFMAQEKDLRLVKR